MTKGHPTKPTDAGFTLVELMVVLAITVIFAVIATVGYRQGVYREYALSQQARSLVNALHVAQWRALQVKSNVIISTGTSTDPVGSTGWYATVTFVTPTNHGFQTGDWVVFANLGNPTVASPPVTGHPGMNVGRYYVTKIDKNTFKCDYYTRQITADTDPGPPSKDRPVVMNMRAASTLIFVKKSYVDGLDATDRATILDDPQNYIYNDTEMRVWDGTDTTLTTSILDDKTLQWSVVFDSRGFPINTAGYTILVGKAPADLKAQKFIRISPTGRISPGA